MRERDLITLTFSGDQIQEGDSIEYLCIVLDKKLNFHDVLITRRLAEGALKVICPYISAESNSDVRRKIHLYKACIRNILLYAVPVWGSSAKMRCNKLEVVERICLKLALVLRRREISNRNLYEQTEIMIMYELATEMTRQFYNSRTQKI